jgi:predicted dehydrogenase
MNQKAKASRRDFLTSSLAVGAGAAFAGQVNIARMAHAAGSDTIKVALIGAGGRGTGAVSQLMSADKNLKLVAIADAFEKQVAGALRSLQKQYPGQVDVPPDRMFSGLECHKGAVASDATLIVIATPPGFRPIQYRAAIDASKHVFMEKPVCVDAPGFNSVMQTNKMADEKGLFVGVGLQRHHEPKYIETVKRLQDGAIGDLICLRAYWNNPGIWNRARSADMTEMMYQVHNWYHFVWLSGDNICEQHIHNLDVCNWVKDAHPVEANGMGACLLRYAGKNKGTGQIFDEHFVEFTYPDGSKLYSQCRHIPNCFDAVSEWAHGASGTSEISRGRIDGKEKWRFPGKEVNGHQQEQTDLVAALRAGKRYNEGYFGANSSMTSVLGRMATYSGKTVKWDEAVANGKGQFPKVLTWDAPAPVTKDEEGNYPIAVPGRTDPFTA